MATIKRTQSKNEAKIILDLEWRGQKTITLGELRQAIRASEGYARHLAHRLTKKGWLERLRPGLFQLVPADRGIDRVADTHPLGAGAERRLLFLVRPRRREDNRRRLAAVVPRALYDG